MIEWYRLGFDLAQLIGEVEALVDLVLGAGRYRHLSYRQLLREGVGVEPYAASERDLREALAVLRVELSPNAGFGRRDLLDLLVTHAIDSMAKAACSLRTIREDQAALARIVTDAEGHSVAKRFELIVDGIEIANGYDELVDAEVLERRMARRSCSPRCARVANNPRSTAGCSRRCAAGCRVAPAWHSASIDC